MDNNVGSSAVENFDVRPSKKAKCTEFDLLELDKMKNDHPMPSTASPTRGTFSSVSEFKDNQISEEKHSGEVIIVDPMPSTASPTIETLNNVGDTYDYLPQDYTLTNMDVCAQIIIETSSKDDLPVKMDEISVKQHQLLCLLDQSKWLDDDIFLPINIKDTHWYLAVLNARKSEIQVLDSLCWEFNRADLTIMLQGIQYHLDILESQQNLNNHNWKDFHVTEWKLREQLKEPIQKDSPSCGLFVLKFMEYWTGDTLSHQITQENINLFRYKLAGILLCWKSNTVELDTNFQENVDNEANPDDVTILESPNVEKKTKSLCPLSIENKYYSLISILSKMGIRELLGGLCDYIKSINCPQTLEKVWVQNSKPYSIGLTLKKLQQILNDDMPMDIDTFNLFVRKNMFNDIQMVKNQRGMISKHYLDLQFWMITDFGRHPNFRKKLDMERLADSVCCWPGINYSVSTCKLILIPTQCGGEFVLFILDKDTRIVYILDPTPLDPMFQYNPNARYVQKLLWIAEYLPKAMSKAWPGSRWNENVFLWRQIILHDIPVYKRELSGYIVLLFMTSWKGENLQLPTLKEDGYELRKQFLGQLLTYKENESEDNMPLGVLEFLSLIKKSKN